MMDYKSNIINDLTNKIKGIDGDKVITIICPDAVNPTTQFDISANGQIGYGVQHEVMFGAKLNHTLNIGGSVIVRQFTKQTKKIKTHKGLLNVPIKKIYGLVLKNGYCVGLSKEQLEECYSYDAITGKPIKKEEDIIYCDFEYKAVEPVC